MNKNIIIGGIAAVVVVGVIVIVGLTQYGSNPSPSSAVPQAGSASLTKDLSDLSALDSQETALDSDLAVDGEMDSALNEVGEMSPTTSLNDEASDLNSLSNDVSALSGDDAASSEIDQALGQATN